MTPLLSRIRIRTAAVLLLLAAAAALILHLGPAWFASLPVLLAVVYLDRTLIRRVLELDRQVQRLTEVASDSVDTADLTDLGRGRDEIAGLARSLGTLLENLGGAGRAHADQAQLFRAVAETAQGAIFIHRDQILYTNPKAAEWIGLPPDEAVGRSVFEFMPRQEAERFEDLYHRALSGEHVDSTYQTRVRHLDGSERWIEISMSLIGEGEDQAVVAVAFDIDGFKALEAELSQEKERVLFTLDAIADGVVSADADARVDFMNRRAEELTGWGRDEALGQPVSEVVALLDEVSGDPLEDPLMGCGSDPGVDRSSRSATLLSRGGDGNAVEVSAATIHDQARAAVGAVLVLHDVTELRGLARRMSYQASHDALTGLVNRREFEKRLRNLLEERSVDGRGQDVLCYMDLDRFKVINDTCGHMAGDRMLKEITEVIRDQVRESDTVARLGGDEFALLLPGCPPSRAEEIADAVRQAVKAYRFVDRDKIFDLGVSIGVVVLDHRAHTVTEALSAADSACYVAKQQGRDRIHVYSESDEAVVQHRGELQSLHQLQRALEEGRFRLMIQEIEPTLPKVAGGPAGELLVRMLGDDEEEVPPGDFMPAAERYHLMPMVDRWVVREALNEVESGRIVIPEGRSITLNLSGQTLGDPNFLEYVVQCLDEHAVDPGQICFEVTETAVITNLRYARRFINVLRGMNCQFALDDFGSGLSSFAYLRNLSMEYLKIDGSFIRRIDNSMVDRAMVESMVQLARTLGIRTIAEHVETQRVWKIVRLLGIDFVQGHAVGRPRALDAA